MPLRASPAPTKAASASGSGIVRQFRGCARTAWARRSRLSTYHPSVTAGGEKTSFRAAGLRLAFRVAATSSALDRPGIFATPVLGGQASVSLLGVGGRNWASIDATLTGPRGNEISGTKSQALTSVGDLFPQATLKWNQGVNNYMIYGIGRHPGRRLQFRPPRQSGSRSRRDRWRPGLHLSQPRQPARIFGGGRDELQLHQSLDQYQNGLDAHLDTGASYFLTKQLNVGLVGYYFQQITGDHGARSATRRIQVSRDAGIGPQLNYFFPVSDKIQGYVNVKAYREFAAENRPEGWNVWLTIAFSPAPPK